MKNKQFLIGFGIIILIILILIFFNNKANAAPAAKAPVLVNPNSGIDPTVFPLKLGSSGNEVLNVQKYFNANNNCGLTLDGFYGPETESCVKDIWRVTQIDGNTYKNRILLFNTINQGQGLLQQASDALSAYFGGY